MMQRCPSLGKQEYYINPQRGNHLGKPCHSEVTSLVASCWPKATRPAEEIEVFDHSGKYDRDQCQQNDCPCARLGYRSRHVALPKLQELRSQGQLGNRCPDLNLHDLQNHVGRAGQEHHEKRKHQIDAFVAATLEPEATTSLEPEEEPAATLEPEDTHHGQQYDAVRPGYASQATIQISRVRRAWKATRRIGSRRDNCNIVSSVKPTDLIKKETLREVKMQFWERYRTKYPMEVSPSDQLLSRCYREMEERLLTVYDIRRVKTLSYRVATTKCARIMLAKRKQKRHQVPMGWRGTWRSSTHISWPFRLPDQINYREPQWRKYLGATLPSL